MKKYLNIAYLLTLALTVIGCSDDAPDGVSAPGRSDKVEFTINVYAGDPEDKGSRVGALPGDDYFEGPLYQYERMRSLRVIIVRPDGTVEHNELISGELPASGVSFYSGVRLRVEGNETKRVYLFANEASIVPAGSETPFDFNSIPSGSVFPTETIGSLQLATDASGVLVDNCGDRKRYVPMSEVFEVFVKKAGPDGEDSEQTANFFITRAAVKFSFNVSATFTPASPFEISEFAVSSLGDREYLLPTSTEYVPAKYPTSFGDRYIKSYAVPEGAVNSLCSLAVPESLLKFGTDYVPGTVVSFAPQLYFCETMLSGGQCTLKLKLAGNETEAYDAEIVLPNLPSLPRNTHVKVNLTLDRSDLKCRIDVLPYTAVPLNPEFGFDELLPRPPSGGDVPPWLEIDPDEE